MTAIRRTDLARIVGRPEAGDHLFVVAAVHKDDFTGLERFELHPLLPRVYEGKRRTPGRQVGLTRNEVQILPSPAQALEEGLPLRSEAWPTRTRQSLERLYALWLLHEDRQRLLDATAIDQLAHQASLLEYLKSNDLRQLLIADEVGLGKTIEAGLIIKWALEENPGSRILYLAPAMLVDNVWNELRRMSVPARVDRYSSSLSTVTPEDFSTAQLIVASIHRACLEQNSQAWEEHSGAWDLIIVDEAHHLSDWSRDGNQPQRQMRLVRGLRSKALQPAGRFVLMSATPHQGNENKFRNLLRLLLSPQKESSNYSLESVGGRIIYRTKEDVVDWDGAPLFSKRQVNEPTYVALGPEYHNWMDTIGRIFKSSSKGPAAWRKAQALQWAASSPKAGLAYLARLALRSGLSPESLTQVAAALRPYRGVGLNASPEDVLTLLKKQVASSQTEVDPESDEDIVVSSAVDTLALEQALSQGLVLLNSSAMEVKLAPLNKWLETEPDSKFVVFASPLETVDELKRHLGEKLGDSAVVAITGSQKPDERRAAMTAFRREEVRALVASKAGSEGINLQVAHRLIHFDVPWNPMEMEQRVGRVHRYGSTRTVVVDTIVSENSREERMLKRCRARLAQIVEQLFGPGDSEGTRFQEMYSRVMSQVPAEELSQLMAEEGFVGTGEEALDELIQKGFEGWKATDQTLRSQKQETINEVPDRGAANEQDLESFLETLGAQPDPGWSHVRLREAVNERVEETVEARVWRFPSDGAPIRRVTDRIRSLTLRGPAGFQGVLEKAGLNQPDIAAKLREIIGGAANDKARSPLGTSFVDGAGAVRIPEEAWAQWVARTSLDPALFSEGAVLLSWGLRLLHRGTLREAWTGTRTYLSSPSLNGGTWLTPADTAILLRLLWEHRSAQKLQSPPHHRSDQAGFDLTGLSNKSHELSRVALQEAAQFDPQKHEFELVPLTALTLEPRNESADKSTKTLTLEAPNPPSLRPPADFLETFAAAAEKAVLLAAGTPGKHSVRAIVVVVRETAKSRAFEEQRTAFRLAVYVTPGAEPEESSDLSVLEELALPSQLEGLSESEAQTVAQILSSEFQALGGRVLGGAAGF
ncbi:DEAD/DEAH box helicase [Synechococcus sp. CBW1107]|uniref:DEAD/DEAH box helicase n=1 Tax=Synechococcus sp. CBW1107 TaxID=2789857 RepID=UPI002AD30F25|nr:helicase-related protein [Synechococcus sp. CBW1107]CAK6695464.1 RNA polymerase-associated protein RapA [Synechococcus sp. CBW1107]